MKAYRVSVITHGSSESVAHVMYAGTQADAKATRRAFVNDFGVKIDDVKIEDVEIPTAKSELIAFVNSLIG